MNLRLLIDRAGGILKCKSVSCQIQLNAAKLMAQNFPLQMSNDPNTQQKQVK